MPATESPKPADAVGRADPAARGLSRKTFDCAVSLKADGDGSDAGTFDLYAAVFSNVDRQGEIIAPGAFTNLAEFVADGVGLVNHQMADLPVAWVDSAVQDSKGLRIRGRFHSTPEAQACRTVILERIAAGKSVKCSIGYRTDDSQIERADGRAVERLKSVRIYEFSFVNVPANPLAGVTAAKSAAAPPGKAPMTTDHEHEPEPRPSFFESVKEWMGLSTKKGRAISKANHAALATFADAMKDHGSKSKAMGAAACKLGDEMHEHLKAFLPADEAEPDADEADDEGEGDDDPPTKPKPKPKAKAAPIDEAFRKALLARLGRPAV